MRQIRSVVANDAAVLHSYPHLAPPALMPASPFAVYMPAERDVEAGGVCDGAGRPAPSAAVEQSHRLFLCKVDGCGGTFTRKASLLRHSRIHAGHRAFVCQEAGCGRAFMQRWALTQHGLVHSKERRFACRMDGCTLAFAHKSTLRAHQRTHTGERPHVCRVPGCDRTFTQRSSRNRHEQRHTLAAVPPPPVSADASPVLTR